MKITVEFGNDKFPLTWKVNDYQIAADWYEKVKSTLNLGIREVDRFYNFPNQPRWSKPYISNEIRKCMQVIETQYPNYFRGINIPHANMNQDDLNYLHKFFTRIRGSVSNSATTYIKANEQVRDAINDYNNLIHRFESHDTGRPRFVVTFYDEMMEDIKIDDFYKFTLENQFGDMCLNYVQIGKQVIDCFRDHDLTVDEEIRPMHQFGAAFSVKFCEIDKVYAFDINRRVRAWYKNNLMTKLGLDSHDPKLSIGWIRVAKLEDSKYTKNEILEIIGKNDFVSNIYLD